MFALTTLQKGSLKMGLSPTLKIKCVPNFDVLAISRLSRKSGKPVAVLFKNSIFLDGRLSFGLEALDRRGHDEL
jgi:hypothetical protein